MSFLFIKQNIGEFFSSHQAVNLALQKLELKQLSNENFAHFVCPRAQL